MNALLIVESPKKAQHIGHTTPMVASLVQELTSDRDEIGNSCLIISR